MKPVIAAAFALLALLPAACDQGLPDTVPPTIGWVYPHDGDTVNPDVYTIATVATDDRRMRWVAYFIETEMLGLVSQSQADTYRLAIDCRADTGHAYQFRAFAYDEAYNGTFAAVSVYVRR
jgi:hypothetical protein